MELTLLRHGIPADPSAWNGSDATRPLTPEGRVQTRAVISVLSRKGKLGAPTLWSSPYLRTVQTAQIAAEVLGVEEPELMAALASGSDLLLTLTKALGSSPWPEQLMCVGHMPDLGNLISRLTGEPVGRYGLGRAGSARLLGEFRAGGMKLVWLHTAEEALALEP